MKSRTNHSTKPHFLSPDYQPSTAQSALLIAGYMLLFLCILVSFNFPFSTTPTPQTDSSFSVELNTQSTPQRQRDIRKPPSSRISTPVKQQVPRKLQVPGKPLRQFSKLSPHLSVQKLFMQKPTSKSSSRLSLSTRLPRLITTSRILSSPRSLI